MTIQDILSNVNYNIEKIFEELRKRITDLSEITETVEKEHITYSRYKIDFCVIRVKKDRLEIDFKDNSILTDPMGFSWKIGRSKKSKYERRMHIKNVFDIETVYSLIFQSYDHIGLSSTLKDKRLK